MLGVTVPSGPQRSSLNAGPRTLTSNKVAGPIIYSFHLPKMSGNSSGWPSAALDFPVHLRPLMASQCKQLPHSKHGCEVCH